MTARCRDCRKPLDPATRRAGGEVCFDCTTAPTGERFPSGHTETITAAGLRGQPLHLKVGDRIKFLRPDGVIRVDTVRTCFHAFILVAPYAPNYSEPAVVLTEHSWTRVGNIIEILPAAGTEAQS